MGLAQRVKRLTPEEYYRMERESLEKHDYYAGEIFAVAGTTARHSLICTNVLVMVSQRLEDSPCNVYESNLRLKIKATGLRAYPDVSVFSGAMETNEDDSQGETYTNPTVLFEVLSKSTEVYYRGLKSESYRRIELLKAYFLISQETPHVEMYERQSDGSWRFQEARGLEEALKISPLNIDLPLAEIYSRIEFAPPQAV